MVLGDKEHMGEQNLKRQTFGCSSCWPSSAAEAWEAMRSLSIESRPVDESHFVVTIRLCPKCQQCYVSVFTETIDWADGEDPQFWIVLPLTEQEVSKLLQAGPNIELVLNTLAPQRRSLRRDFPKGENPRGYWSSGISVRPHD
jgi:hypothetical protein